MKRTSGILTNPTTSLPANIGDHTAFYPVGDFAGIEVRYGINGTSAQFAVLYFKVDDAFPKLRKVGEQGAYKPAGPKKEPAVIRKHTIDVHHWNRMKDGMNKEQIAEIFSAPAGDYAPGTDYLTRCWGWRRSGHGKVHETLEWRSEKGASSSSSMRRGTSSPPNSTIPAATPLPTSPSG